MAESTQRWRSEFACGCDSYTTLYRPVLGQLAVCHAHGETRVRAVEHTDVSLTATRKRPTEPDDDGSSREVAE